jgi:hypothetical protein
MTWWIEAAQYATEALSLILILRLFLLRDRREKVYLIFALFLVAELLSSLGFFILRHRVDYRLLWIFTTSLLWIFYLAVVYSLARAVLAELPGILRFSRKFLIVVFPLSILVALSTARGEYWATGGASFKNQIDRVLVICYVLDRAISMSALLVLIVILAFILWFPVKMSRNLAILSVGFVVYFGALTGLDLLRSYSGRGMFQRHTIAIFDVCANLVLVLCFAYWIAFMDLKGKTAQVRIGHSWRPADQTRLIQQLESLDLALLQSSRRFGL